MRFLGVFNNGIQHKWLWVGIILPITLMYSSFLQAPLVFDDFAFIYPATKQSIYWDALLNFNLRSIPYATFEWTRLWFGQNLWGWHLGNLLLHLAVCICLYLFFQSLFNFGVSNQQAESFSRSRYLAFCGALLFGLHPAAVYAVGYLSQRSILMATLFTLLMWQFVVVGCYKNRIHYFWLSAGCYFLAMLSKEHAFMAPAVAVVLFFYCYPQLNIKFNKLIPVLLTYIAVAVFVAWQAKNLRVLGEAYQAEAGIALNKLGIAPPVVQNSVPQSPIPSSTIESEITSTPQPLAVAPEESLIQHLHASSVRMQPDKPLQINLSYIYSVITEGYLFFKYLSLWLYPNAAMMAIDIFYPFVTHIFSWPEILGLLCFLLYPMVALRILTFRGDKGLVGLAMLCPWLMFFTEFAVIRVQESFVLYRSYLWMPGIFLALPWVFRQISLKYSLIILLVCILGLLPLTWGRLKTFNDSVLLWDDAAKLLNGQNLEILPGVERVFYNRGIFLDKAHREPEAIIDFTKTIAIAKDQGYLAVNAYFNRGRIYFEQEQYQLAEQDFSKVIALEPSNSNAYILKGQALEKLNQSGAAESTFKENFLRNLPFK